VVWGGVALLLGQDDLVDHVEAGAEVGYTGQQVEQELLLVGRVDLGPGLGRDAHLVNGGPHPVLDRLPAVRNLQGREEWKREKHIKEQDDQDGQVKIENEVQVEQVKQ
jgi:hypothetical protein